MRCLLNIGLKAAIHDFYAEFKIVNKSKRLHDFFEITKVAKKFDCCSGGFYINISRRTAYIAEI